MDVGQLLLLIVCGWLLVAPPVAMLVGKVLERRRLELEASMRRHPAGSKR